MERNILRIIDANFNRAREGVRVMEELCRFVLEDTALSARAKQLRHQLSSAVSKSGLDEAIVCRDTGGDVGRGVQLEDQMQRGGLADTLSAAAKRTGEALRVMAEMAQVLGSDTAAEFERLRFEAYAMEKDIAQRFNANQKFSDVKLYVLLTVTDVISDEQVLELARKCADGGADCLQLRAKGIDDKRVYRLAKKFVEVCGQAGVVSIINDRSDIAVAAGADGVHLGQNDMPINEARKLATKPMIFGVSTHCIEQLREAINSGADYVGLGPVFSTETKPGKEAVGLEYVNQAIEILKETGVYHVAIGGINLENIEQVKNAGAKAIAVCGVAVNAKDSKQMCEKLKSDLILS